MKLIELLNESLMKTYPLVKFTSALTKKFPFVKIQAQPDNTCLITVNWKNKDTLKAISNLGKLYGWFCSLSFKDNDDGNTDLDELVNSKFKTCSLVFEAIYDIEISKYKIPSELYHLTAEENIDKIKKYGLIAKSRSKLAYHPERIYLATDNIAAKALIGKMQQLTGNYKWVIITINKHKLNKNQKFYQDPNYHSGIYTLDNISPEAFSNFEYLDFSKYKTK